jgi:predicted component of type VI protein secretion system
MARQSLASHPAAKPQRSSQIVTEIQDRIDRFEKRG